MNQYLKNNPVARAIYENSISGKLFENEAVDNVLRTISDACLDIYQKVVFDIAPARERNPDGSREKLSPIISANTIESLVAVLRNDSAESGVKTASYAESKNLYLQALEKYTEALISACKVNKANEKFILDYMKAGAQVKQRRTEQLAKSAKEENDSKNGIEESYYFNGELDMLNEAGIFTGYKGRVDDLRKILANLILSSNGKTSKNGYGRDWQTTFVDLDEKRKSLDTSKGAFGEKDKKALDDLEKQVDKYRLEYIKASNAAIDKSLTNIQNDEELNGAYGDVNTLCDEAKLLKTRADSQYSTALVAIKDEHKEKEEVFNKTLFPISRGNTDADDKFKDSGLIFAIQKALCDGIPAASKLIKSKGGPNGKYGPATKSVIATIQKMEGNKNVNGEIDQALLSDILASDWVSDENKKIIHKALDVAKVKMNESVSTVFSFDDFIKGSEINESKKITINNDDFEKELDAQYKETISSEPLSQNKGKSEPKEGDEDGDSEGTKSADVNKLAEKLRSVYSLKIEGKSFTRDDGSLKPSYTPGFIKSWSLALDGVKESPKDYKYFFYDGGLYRIDSSKTTLKIPNNWPKFEKVDDKDDPYLFFRECTSPMLTLGSISKQKRFDAIKSVLPLLGSKSITSGGYAFGMNGVYNKLPDFIKYKEIPFVDMDTLKDSVKRAFVLAIDADADDPDMGSNEFLALNNILVSIANCISYDAQSGKFISCLKWIHDNVLTEDACGRIINDRIISVETGILGKGVLVYRGNGINIYSRDEINKSVAPKYKGTSDASDKELPGINILASKSPTAYSASKAALVINSRIILKNIYPLIKTTCKRLNSEKFDDVPQSSGFKCINSEVK